MSAPESPRPKPQSPSPGPACALVLTVYAAAFFLPAVTGRGGGGDFNHGTTWGLGAFFFGLIPPYTLAWAANPALWFGVRWMRLGQWNKARKAGGIAVACALAAIPMVGVSGPGDRLTIGYFVWFGSTMVLLGAAQRGLLLAELELQGKLTPDFLRYVLRVSRGAALLVTLPVACVALVPTSRMSLVDYFAKGLDRPQDGALSLFLEDPSLRVRLHAADRLAHAPGHGGDPQVNRVFCDGTRASTAAERRQTLEILRTLDWPLPVTPSPLRLLTDPDASVRASAAQLLSERPFRLSDVSWEEGRALISRATNDPDPRVSGVASNLLHSRFQSQPSPPRVANPPPRDRPRTAAEHALDGIWRREYEQGGRGHVEVQVFQPDGVWTNWLRHISSPTTNESAQLSTNPLARRATNVVQVSGVWWMENQDLHTFREVHHRFFPHRYLGKVIAAETNRLTLELPNLTTREYQRIPAEPNLDTRILLEPRGKTE